MSESAGTLFTGFKNPRSERASAGRKVSLLLCLFAQRLAQAVALGVLASLPSESKWVRKCWERGQKKNVSKQVFSVLRYSLQCLVMDRFFFPLLICSTQEIFVVVSWNSKHGARIHFLAEVCGVQIPAKPLGFEVVCLFPFNVVENRSCLQQRQEIKPS